VGVVFSYPIGNDAAEANTTASRLRIRQTKVQIRSLETSAALNVRAALRNVATRKRQIEVGEKGVQDAQVRLASYIKRQKIGLATTKDVLQVEADLSLARLVLATARADYQGAFTQLWLNTGELLERQGIRVPDPEIEKMAWKELP
jgi:outer membrane protein TolC